MSHPTTGNSPSSPHLLPVPSLPPSRAGNGRGGVEASRASSQTSHRAGELCNTIHAAPAAPTAREHITALPHPRVNTGNKPFYFSWGGSQPCFGTKAAVPILQLCLLQLNPSSQLSHHPAAFKGPLEGPSLPFLPKVQALQNQPGSLNCTRWACEPYFMPFLPSNAFPRCDAGMATGWKPVLGKAAVKSTT